MPKRTTKLSDVFIWSLITPMGFNKKRLCCVCSISMDPKPQQGRSGDNRLPKPWEISGSAPFRPSSPGRTSDVVEASGTARRRTTLVKALGSEVWKRRILHWLLPKLYMGQVVPFLMVQRFGENAYKLFDCLGMLYGELARYVLRLLGFRTKPRKVPPPGHEGFPGNNNGHGMTSG
ncbi:hypothetical protein GIB67_035531 [Kingdonia uniflora]|uniref:Peroxin-13 n=1 Tax=Kingdonia uniflora TaxID=39325 RepID=A0A7J7MC42_9MAGN|nr:hypothetical protein GIB67_035531 [Kingdonia uniflora]